MSSIPELTAAPVPDGAMLFNRYRFLREIGRGGMGRVILAQDEVLAIEVALKLVPEEVVRDAGGLRDLKREVLRGMALTHPNIVRVHSFEQDADRGAIVMEYIDGETLADAKERRPQGCYDHETLRPWLEQLCSVLDHAHREVKIAHRDLKPRNLLLTRDAKIKVADFGISCSLADTVHRLTTQSVVAGTPPYMSPQQAMGEPPSHLDDIYSLGATLFDLLTGRPPFYRGNVVMQAMQQRPPTVAARRAELGKDMPPVPETWEQLIAACLAKRPEDRPGSGQEILALLHGETVTVRRGARSPLESTPPAPHTGGATTQERFATPTPPRPLMRVRRRFRRGEPNQSRGSAARQFASLAFTAVTAAAMLAGVVHFARRNAADWLAANRPAGTSRATPAVRSAVTQSTPIAATPGPVYPPPPAPIGAPLPSRFENRTSLQPASGLDRPPPEQRPPPPPRKGPR